MKDGKCPDCGTSILGTHTICVFENCTRTATEIVCGEMRDDSDGPGRQAHLAFCKNHYELALEEIPCIPEESRVSRILVAAIIAGLIFSACIVLYLLALGLVGDIAATCQSEDCRWAAEFKEDWSFESGGLPDLWNLLIFI